MQIDPEFIVSRKVKAQPVQQPSIGMVAVIRWVNFRAGRKVGRTSQNRVVYAPTASLDQALQGCVLLHVFRIF